MNEEWQLVITLKQLEALRWIAVLGSFEKAAERLHTTQSAISKRVQELEAALGTAVFDRSQRSARLTVKGEALLLISEEMLGLRDRALAVGSSKRMHLRQLRFGVTELTALTWLPAFVLGIREAYPNAALEPEVEQSVELFDRLRHGTLDFIIVPDAFWHPDFRKVALANVQIAWMCSPILHHDRGGMKLEELSNFSVLTQGERSGSGLVIERWLQESGTNVPRLIRSNSLVALVGLTIAAIGVSYLPQRCFEGLVEQGTLRIIETDPPLPPITYIVMFRGNDTSEIPATISHIAKITCDFSRSILGLGR
jgi:DNA-binding transcriptional LysR family regulator